MIIQKKTRFDQYKKKTTSSFIFKSEYMRNKQINGRYSGVYFCVNYFNHVYEPTLDITKHLLVNFKHKYATGVEVSYRERHKETKVGFIDIAAYSTEKNGGGTIKVYLINNRWIEESRIKDVLQPTK